MTETLIDRLICDLVSVLFKDRSFTAPAASISCPACDLSQSIVIRFYLYDRSKSRKVLRDRMAASTHSRRSDHTATLNRVTKSRSSSVVRNTRERMQRPVKSLWRCTGREVSCGWCVTERVIPRKLKPKMSKVIQRSRKGFSLSCVMLNTLNTRYYCSNGRSSQQTSEVTGLVFN